MSLPTCSGERCDCQVAEEKSEDGLLSSLSRYLRRPQYVRRCLSELFNRTDEFKEPRPDIVKVW